MRQKQDWPVPLRNIDGGYPKFLCDASSSDYKSEIRIIALMS